MKVSEKVLDKYIELCHFSAKKSNSFSEIEEKIIRAVRIGTVIMRDKRKRTVGYHNLNFVVRDNIVINMWKDLNETKYTKVSDILRMRYDEQELKILV